MARGAFKRFMNERVSHHAYHFYEKGAFELLSGLILYAIMFLHKTTDERFLLPNLCYEVIPLFNTLKFTSYIVTIAGAFFLTKSLLDMWQCNLFQFRFPEHFKRTGCEVPGPFVMKTLSRVALSCRNPLMTGWLLFLTGPLLFPATTNGLKVSTLFLSSLFIAGVFTGVFFEQRELKRTMG